MGARPGALPVANVGAIPVQRRRTFTNELLHAPNNRAILSFKRGVTNCIRVGLATRTKRGLQLLYNRTLSRGNGFARRGFRSQGHRGRNNATRLLRLIYGRNRGRCGPDFAVVNFQCTGIRASVSLANTRFATRTICSRVPIANDFTYNGTSIGRLIGGDI